MSTEWQSPFQRAFLLCISYRYKCIPRGGCKDLLPKIVYNLVINNYKNQQQHIKGWIGRFNFIAQQNVDDKIKIFNDYFEVIEKKNILHVV